MRSDRLADGAGAPSAPRPLSSQPAWGSQQKRTSSAHDAAEGAEDQDTGDVPDGVDEDALEADDLDTDQIASTE